MNIQYLSHSCFQIESKGMKLLTDPFLSENPKAKTLPDQLDPDLIAISHGHFDHVLDAESIAKRTQCDLVAMVEVAEWFKKKGIKHTHGLNFGGTFQSRVFTLKYVQAHHSSSMPDGSYGGSPGSFFIDDEDTKVFFAGDTSLHYDLKMFGEVYRPDHAILPIGGTFTMDVDDAVIAAEFLGTKKVIGCHYDTMPILQIDHSHAREMFAKRGLELVLLEVGQSVTL